MSEAIMGRNRSSNQPELGQVKQRPLTAIYFRKPSGPVMKRLAIRVRDSGVECHLIWASNFRDTADINSNARAVIIEVDAPNRKFIAQCYERFSHDVEIHYVNAEGEFVEPGEEPGDSETPAAIPGIAAKEADPQEAIKNLKSKQQAEPKPDASEQSDEDKSDEPSGDGGEDSKSKE